MIKIDRIELADIGNPVLLAKAVIEQLPNIKLPIPVREIAYALDIIEIKPITTSGFEGGLITSDDKSSGSILINENNFPRRQRFTIGHELGHYLNPWHDPGSAGQFMCEFADMKVSQYKPNDTRKKMEVEANLFSAELLMPSKFLQAELKRLGASEIDHIVTLSNKFDVSKESLGRRYIEFQDEPCALVFSINDTVSYTVKEKYFPQLDVWKSDIIPSDTLTRNFDGQPGTSSGWQEHDSEVWLRNSNKYKTVQEQVLVQENGYRITLLTLDDEVDEDEDD